MRGAGRAVAIIRGPLKLSQSATNDGDKALLLQMAETWRHLAELAEARMTERDEDDR